MKGKFRL